MSCIHFEGIPGAGKSTAAEKFCDLLAKTRNDAYWVLEESPDHPIMPNEIRALSTREDFPQICLDQWRSLLQRHNGFAIFDGYALQTTVRFLFANQVELSRIEAYFNDWQEIGKDTPLIFLEVNNPDEHFENLIATRGQRWAERVIAYVERTPYCVANKLTGTKGFTDFWWRYQDLCLRLLNQGALTTEFWSAQDWSNNTIEDATQRLLAD